MVWLYNVAAHYTLKTMNEREKMTLMDDSSLRGPEGITLYKMDACLLGRSPHSSLKLKLFLFCQLSTMISGKIRPRTNFEKRFLALMPVHAAFLGGKEFFSTRPLLLLNGPSFLKNWIENENKNNDWEILSDVQIYQSKYWFYHKKWP